MSDLHAPRLLVALVLLAVVLTALLVKPFWVALFVAAVVAAALHRPMEWLARALTLTRFPGSRRGTGISSDSVCVWV